MAGSHGKNEGQEGAKTIAVKEEGVPGIKKRWQDQMAGDLQVIGLKDGWYQLCQNREAWFANCYDCVNKVA